MNHTIDATEKRLGRVATEASVILMGKNRTDFQKNTIPNIKLTITNASKLSIDTKKMKDKMYRHYTGYPGGLKEKSMEKIIETKGYGDILRKAITGMLPKNTLRAKMLKNLTITE